MAFADLLAALLLPVPPWLGFWIFRRKGRIGLSYGYFLGGILTILALPWSRLTGVGVPTAQLGGALFGFTLFLQAQREGVHGVRRLAMGVGGATGVLTLLLLRFRLPWHEVAHFWAGAALESLLWLLCSDLAYRWAKGRQLEVRMPLVGAATLGLGALAQALLPAPVPRLSWPAALLAGILLGLVALQQLRWLRGQGAWVEGRGEGLRLALALLEPARGSDQPSLSLGLEAQQAIWLVDAKGSILESNGPFSQLAGLPRHRLRGYTMDAIFQGGETAVWEGLRTQLLQFGHASLQATQVSDDGTFRQVGIEAATFDRGMALVWISDTTSGALGLVGRGIHEAGGAEEARRLRANALLALSSAMGRFRSAPAEGGLYWAARQVTEAAARLDPFSEPALPRPALDGRAELTRVLARIQSLLPLGGSIRLEATELPLAVDSEVLGRIATHLALHAIEDSPSGRLSMVLESVALGPRLFGLLQVREDAGRSRRVRTVFGLGWLRQSVLEAGGLLELDQDAQGGVRPRIYLPTASPLTPDSLEHPLAGRTLWVVDQDSLAREALLGLVRLDGGEAIAFEDLRSLLRGSRGMSPPDVLVLERTPQLERFHRSMRAFQKEPVPTLVMGMGQPLPVNPNSLGLSRLGFLEKPFRPEAFLESVLALLSRPEAPEPGLL
jgi:PAS domain-containing protein